MNKLFDLRFVIGIFFTVVGLLLLAYGLLSHALPSMQSINRCCGGIFAAFGVLMLVISFREQGND